LVDVFPFIYVIYWGEYLSILDYETFIESMDNVFGKNGYRLSKNDVYDNFHHYVVGFKINKILLKSTNKKILFILKFC